MPASGLAIVIFAVQDLARAVAFYKTAFECTEAVTSPVYVELELGGPVRLGLYERTAFGRNIGRVPPAASDVSSTELYLRVPSLPTNLEAAGARLLSTAQARPWGETVAYYADPDGNVLAITVPG